MRNNNPFAHSLFLILLCGSLLCNPIWFPRLEAASPSRLSESSQIIFQQAQGIVTQSNLAETDLSQTNHQPHSFQSYDLKLHSLPAYLKIKTYAANNPRLHFNLPPIIYNFPVAEYTCDG